MRLRFQQPLLNLQHHSNKRAVSCTIPRTADPVGHSFLRGAVQKHRQVHSDLDRGFSVIDYTLNQELAGPQDMEGLKALGLKLKLDFILNHASVLSPQFQDLLKNGKNSFYRDFFINWNDFWQGYSQ